MYSTNFKEKVYKKYNSEYVKILKRYEKEYDPRLDFISRISFYNKKILDIGCGTGKISSLFTKDNKVYGIDISPKILNVAKKRNIITKQINLDKNKIPFKNNFFNIIFLFDIVEHVFLPEKLLKESYNLLNNNGEIYITTHNAKIKDNLSNKYDLSLFEVEELKQILLRIGFKNIRIYGWSWQEPKHKNIIDNLKKFWLWHNPKFAKDVYIIAKK